MKRMFKLLSAMMFACSIAGAQVVSSIRPPETAKIGEFTEWQTVEVSFDDGTKANIEYRSGLMKRKGIACHYTVEVKNNSDQKLDIRMKSSYYDKLVKGNFGDEIKETLKPGKAIAGIFIAQGCRKEKDVEKSDEGHCFACDFGVNLFVKK